MTPQYLAATRFDQLLHYREITSLGGGATTNRHELMRESCENLDMLKTTVPRMHRCLLLNRRFGNFKLLAGNPPATLTRAHAPDRLLLSISTFLIHSFRVYAEQPIFAATDSIAAQRDECSCS